MAGRGRDAPVGGQAVLEGVMMRGVRTWSVAVRSPTEAQLEQISTRSSGLVERVSNSLPQVQRTIAVSYWGWISDFMIIEL